MKKKKQLYIFSDSRGVVGTKTICDRIRCITTEMTFKDLQLAKDMEKLRGGT